MRRPFDESFRIAADYDFLCDRLLSNATWEYRPLPVSRLTTPWGVGEEFITGNREKRGISLSRFPREEGGYSPLSR